MSDVSVHRQEVETYRSETSPGRNSPEGLLIIWLPSDQVVICPKEGAPGNLGCYLGSNLHTGCFLPEGHHPVNESRFISSCCFTVLFCTRQKHGGRSKYVCFPVSRPSQKLSQKCPEQIRRTGNFRADFV